MFEDILKPYSSTKEEPEEYCCDICGYKDCICGESGPVKSNSCGGSCGCGPDEPDEDEDSKSCSGSCGTSCGCTPNEPDECEDCGQPEDECVCYEDESDVWRAFEDIDVGC